MKRPKEKMQLIIEFADNGIILRNPDLEDEVTLALDGPSYYNPDSVGYEVDHSNEYKAIGKKIYDWIEDVVIPEYRADFIPTGADLEIVATLSGRTRE